MRTPSLAAPAVLCLVILAAAARADGPPAPPSGQARLASGRVVEYAIHFDRNSLRDSLRAGDGLIALTSSGALLRFDLPAFRLVRERVDTERVTCLGRGEAGEALAGLADGRVVRVDPATLDLADVARVPGVPRWVGWGPAARGRPAGLVVVARKAHSAVHDLAAGKTFAIDEEATPFLLDGAGRFWLGADKGEWGGRLTRIDLAGGTVTEVDPPPGSGPGEEPEWSGVYGLVALRDGQVWAFGGTSHLGLHDGFIARVDGDRPRPLLEFKYSAWRDTKPAPDRPMLPITHVVEEDGGLLVFSYSDVFRVDKALKSWKKAATLALQYRWGRPDAIGAYPSVVAVHPPSRAGGPYVLATVGDGYVVLEGAKAASHALPGQLGASRADRVASSSEGLLAFEQDDERPAWRLAETGWEVAPVEPPYEIDPADRSAEFERRRASWYETRVLVDRFGGIIAVSSTGSSPGTRTTARRADGTWVRLGRETSSLAPSASFLTADGTLWNARYGGLSRFEQGGWRAVAVASHPLEQGPSRLVPVGEAGPPWLLHDRSYRSLWELTHGPRGEDPRLARVEVRDGSGSLAVAAAIPWPGGSLLLATGEGLRVYDPAARRVAKLDLDVPVRRVQAMVRDGLGRLWLGGWGGLALAEAGARAADSLAPVPWIRQGDVAGLAPDPRHEDGVIASLGARGIVFVRAPR